MIDMDTERQRERGGEDERKGKLSIESAYLVYFIISYLWCENFKVTDVEKQKEARQQYKALQYYGYSSTFVRF